MKAKYIRKIRNKYNNRVQLCYEYRGHEYIVEDHHNGCMDSLKAQHEYEQERIDMMIERQNQPIKEGTFDIDEVFEMLEW